MGLSRENPQYLQLLMHSFERYNGAKSRITRPKCCRVRSRERTAIDSNARSSPGLSRRSKAWTDGEVRQSEPAKIFAKDMKRIPG